MSSRQTKMGVREDLGHFVRSSWEANIARYYKHIGVAYQYEPKIFYFIGVKNGAVNYKPDFYLPDTDTYIEVKGQMTSVDRTKMKRMKKYHPDVKVQMIGAEEYKRIEKQYSHLIPNWEFKEKKKRNVQKEKVAWLKEYVRELGIVLHADEDEPFDLALIDENQAMLIRVVYLEKDQTIEDYVDEFNELQATTSPVGVSKRVVVFRHGKSNKSYEEHTLGGETKWSMNTKS
jgi:hypothetical protein